MPALDLAMAAALGVAVLVVLLPGLGVGLALGLRGIPLLGLAGPASIAVLGAAGIVLGLIRVPFEPWSALVASAVAVAIAAGIGRLLRTGSRPLGTAPRPVVIAAGGGMLLGAVALAALTLSALGRPDAISQTYDAVFHLSAASSIEESGDASSLTLYRLLYPGVAFPFYPAGFHTLVALVSEISGSGIPRAMTATWIATSALIVLPGGVWLTDALLGGRVRSRAVLLGAAGVLGACFAGLPYLLLAFGTLYPMGLASDLLPSGVAIAVLALAPLSGDAADPVRARPWVLAAVWLVAGVVAHPRTLVGFVMLLAPLLITVLALVVRRAWVTPRGRRGVITAAAASGALLLIGVALGIWALFRVFHIDRRPISDRLNGGPARADQSVLDAILQALGQAPPLAPDDGSLWPAVPIAVLVILGAVLAVRERRLLWVPIGLTLAMALYVLAASSDSDLAKLATALWYKDKFRLYALIPVLALPLAAWGVAWLVELSGRIRRPLLRALAVGVAAALALGGIAPTAIGVRAAIARTFEVPNEHKNRKIADDELYALLERLPEHVPEGELVLGDPWTGASLSWPIGGREPVYPHLTGGWTAEQRLVRRLFADIATDPRVCAALDELDAHYLLTDTERLWGIKQSSTPFKDLRQGVDRAGFELVDEEGSARLWRITACD